MSECNTRKTTEYPILLNTTWLFLAYFLKVLFSMEGIFFWIRFAALTQLFTVCCLAHTDMSKISKAALLSFSWTGTAPTDHAICSAERDISSAGYA